MDLQEILKGSREISEAYNETLDKLRLTKFEEVMQEINGNLNLNSEIIDKINNTAAIDMSELLNMSVSVARYNQQFLKLTGEGDSFSSSLSKTFIQANNNYISDGLTINIPSSNLQDIVGSLINATITEAYSCLQGNLKDIPDVLNKTFTSSGGIRSNDKSYTVEEIVAESQKAVEEYTEEGTENLSDVRDARSYIQSFFENLRTKHPAVYNSITIVIYCALLFGSFTDIQSGANVVASVGQDIVIKVDNNENIYHVNNSAGTTIYEEPNAHTEALLKIYYGDSVTKIKGTEMWTKISYTAEDGESYVGWVASSDLIDYKEYKYNNDDF